MSDASERIKRARDALVATSYFAADQVDDDIAPRIIELASWSPEAQRLFTGVHDGSTGAGLAPTVVKHKVGKCPACREYLWAEVTIEVTLSSPTLNDDGRAEVGAYAQPVAMSVSHACDKREPLAPWEAELLRDAPAPQSQTEPTQQEEQ